MKKSTLSLLPLAGTLSCFAQEKSIKPHIIFFLVDDMGWQKTSVPFWKEKTILVKWPGVTTDGAVCNQPLIIEDFFPSILEMAGVKRYSQIGGVIDGKSFVPLLRGKKVNSENSEFFWPFPHNYGEEPYSVIRKGDWKLIYWYKGSKLELYNIPDYISESNDLAAANPENTKELAIELGKYLRKVNTGRPAFKATGKPCLWPDESPQIQRK
ncbi:MAG: hypothetical protein Q8907_02535 [Bacteroidota bacterium]|nr:hypothetical protein [Bacteroidota bacterium]